MMIMSADIHVTMKASQINFPNLMVIFTRRGVIMMDITENIDVRM